VEIRKCKRDNNLDNLKSLIKKRRNLNQQLIYATKNQWKDFDRQEDEEIEHIKMLDPDGKAAAQTLKIHRQWKKTRHLFQKIAKYAGKARTKEAFKLQVGDKWIEDPNEILNEIVAHNKVHFSQAKGCALSNRSLQQVTDPNSLPDLNNLPELERKFIQEMNSFQTTTIRDEIEFEVWRQKFKTWRKTTWKSPSRLHLGHFKSLVVIPYQWDHDHCKRDNQMESYQQELLESTLCIVNFSIQSGTILDRWINATNIMITKKNGSYKVTDYRNIHIYECDMNAMLSLKWKEALKQSEDQNVICPSQVGGRKQR
jgi:hypothetical protein